MVLFPKKNWDQATQKRVGEKVRQGMKVSAKEREQGRRAGSCIYLMITFLLVVALETPAPEALPANPNHKQTKKW